MCKHYNRNSALTRSVITRLQCCWVAEWLACWTQAQKGLGSNRSRRATFSFFSVAGSFVQLSVCASICACRRRHSATGFPSTSLVFSLLCWVCLFCVSLFFESVPSIRAFLFFGLSFFIVLCYASAVYAMALRLSLSVCICVCLSVFY